ncbi:ferritin [Balneicella halophila]|uniref:Ferritin n=1 Tax=Balneicella halophila TaxID=1537566 RepID=A0A7L4UPT0_BALHA|nr:ferritin [Balneicella halophila]PVX51766.1 ferritin [Balneicella halophila]
MALNKKVEEVLNKQINAEFWSAYMYLSMSSYLEKKGLSGFAHWLKMQYHEENEHGMKLFEYIIERDGRVLLEPIKKVPHEWDGILDLFEQVLEHEKHVTSLINKCMNTAQEESDHATVSMLQWFVDEQVEEESTSRDILDKLRIIGGEDGQGLYMMNEEFRGRTLE